MVKLTDAIKSNGINPTSNGSFKNIIDNCKNTNRSGDRTKLSWWENYSYSLKSTSDSSISCRGEQKTLNAEYSAPAKTSLKPTVKWTAASGNPNGAIISETTIIFGQNDTSSNRVYNFNGTCTENTINLTTTAKITQIANKNKFKFVFKNTSGTSLSVSLQPTLASGTILKPKISFAGETSNIGIYGGYADVTSNQTITVYSNGNTYNSKEFVSYHKANDLYGKDIVITNLPIHVSGTSLTNIPVTVGAKVEIKRLSDDAVWQIINYADNQNGFKSGWSSAEKLYAQSVNSSNSYTWRANLAYYNTGATSGNFMTNENAALYYADTTIYITFSQPGGGGTTPTPDPSVKPEVPKYEYYY